MIMAGTGIIGLARWVIANADRVLRLLQGLTARLPEIGGTMERAGQALAAAGATLGGTAGGGGARAEVERIQSLLERYEAAVADAVDDLRSASASLGAIKVPSVSIGEKTVRIAGIGIDIPVVHTSDQTPLQGIADVLERQIAQLNGLSQPLRGARDGVANLGALLGGTATELTDVGTLLMKSGTELKALA
jgi:hypothetical protein